VPYLAPIWAAHRQRRLVEPFCGGLAVALGLAPAAALLNDQNPHLIAFYRHLKRGLHVRLPMANDAALYYRHRALFNRLVASRRGSSRCAAELFYYLNRTGYNGLCRFNRRGAFNVPFGRYATIHYLRDFTPYRAALARWRFTAGPFHQVPLEPDDFIYADPPYDVPFTQYAREGFSWTDQERLALWLARHPGPVLLSNQATPRILALYRDLGFTLQLLDGPRLINCTGDRTPAREVLALRGLHLNDA
jgi:DNA adenine methylase